MSSKETSTLTLYLPSDWATDGEPLYHYFQDNFVEFCQESDNKDLNNRANSILKSPNTSSRIQTIYNGQKHRVWLFFDHLYDKKLDDNHSYGNFNDIRLEARGISDITYKQIYSNKVSNWLKPVYRKFFQDFLVDGEYLIVNNSYIPWYFSFEDNRKPKGYRLSDWVYSEEVNVVPKQIELDSKKANLIDKKYSYAVPKLPSYTEDLKKHYQQWSVTNTDKKHLFNDQVLSIHQKINTLSELDKAIKLNEKKSDSWFKYNFKFGKRIYHKNAQLKKTYRKFISHPSKVGQEKCLIEHRNCLIYLYSIFLLKYQYEGNLKFEKYPSIVEKFDLRIVKEKDIKEELVEIFSELILNREVNLNTTSLKKYFSFNEEEMELISKILYCYTESKKPKDGTDIWTILIMSKLSITYDVIFNLYQAVNDEVDFSLTDKKIRSRKDFKIAFNRFLNFPLKSINHVEDIAIFSAVIKHFFPHFHQLLRNHKYNSHKNVAHIAFNMESKLMVEGVAQHLIKKEEKIPFYTIHDGIVCYQDDANQVKELVENKSKELFRLTSPIEIEEI